MNEEAKNVVAAVGAMAEMTAIFYQGLLNNDVEPSDALWLTREFLANSIKSGNKEETNE